MQDRMLSRRQFLVAPALTFGIALVAACTPAAVPPQSGLSSPPPPTAPAATTAVAGSRPDWLAAASAYKGSTLSGLTSTEDSGKLVGKLAEDFGQQTGMTIKVENLPVPGYPPKLQAELVARSGNLDFIAMLIQDIGQYAKAGLLEPLDPYLAKPSFPDYNLHDFPDNALNVFAMRDGKVYGLPVLGGAQIMYYRKDLLDQAGVKPPTTWQEVYEAAKKLRKNDVWGVALDLKGPSATRFGSIFPSGLQWLDQDLRMSVLRDPQTIENFDTWQCMFKEGLMAQDALANDLNATYAMFQAGKAALLPLGWPVFVTSIVDPAKSQVATTSGFAPVPGGAPAGSGWTFVIPSDSKNKEAAFLTTSWVTNPANSALQIASAGNTDAGMRRSIFNDTLRQAVGQRPFGKYELEGLAAFTQTWPSARFIPTIPEWPKLQDVLAPAFQSVIGGQAGTRDGLSAAADACEKILAEAGYYKRGA